MRIYALVKKGTWTVFLPKIGPFDGHTLEEAEQAVVDTLFVDPPRCGTPHAILCRNGLECVPITEAHAMQYARAAAS